MGSDEKPTLRRELLAARDALPADLRRRHSAAIAAQVAALPAFRGARRIALYAEIGSEVETGPLDRAAREGGAEVLYPRILAGGELGFFRARREELVPAVWGIPTPPLEEDRRVEAAAVDLFVVPALAFDLRGHRLGYGRGYYDRTLSSAPAAATIGIAFDVQIVPDLPAESRDVPVGRVVTELRSLPGGPPSSR